MACYSCKLGSGPCLLFYSWFFVASSSCSSLRLRFPMLLQIGNPIQRERTNRFSFFFGPFLFFLFTAFSPWSLRSPNLSSSHFGEEESIGVKVKVRRSGEICEDIVMSLVTFLFNIFVCFFGLRSVFFSTINCFFPPSLPLQCSPVSFFVAFAMRRQSRYNVRFCKEFCALLFFRVVVMRVYRIGIFVHTVLENFRHCKPVVIITSVSEFVWEKSFLEWPLPEEMCKGRGDCAIRDPLLRSDSLFSMHMKTPVPQH